MLFFFILFYLGSKYVFLLNAKDFISFFFVLPLLFPSKVHIHIHSYALLTISANARE